MKYIVVGEPCVDVIHKVNGETIHSYGGILYSVISMAVLCGKDDLVFPVMNLGEDEFDNIIKILSKYTAVDTSFVNKVSHSTRKVYLDYTLYNSDKRARFETSTEPTYPVEYDLLKKALPGVDAVLINMISGIDITLDNMLKLRKNFNGYIHIDIHNLVMKTNSDGTRVHTNLENWKQWCTTTNTVQMNEFEIKMLDEKVKKEYEIVEEVLIKSGKNVEGFIVTRGINGVSGYTKKEKSFAGEKFTDLDKIDLSAIETPHFVDTTGCGDVFAASFALDYSKNSDFAKSLHYANRNASYTSSLEGIDELYKLK